MTVTATQGGSTNAGMAMGVLLYSNAQAPAAQVGGTDATHTTTTGALQTAITPTATGSLVVGAMTNGINTTFTALASTTLKVNFNAGATASNEIGTMVSSATTTSGTPVTIGASAPTNGTGGQIVLTEILSNGGTLTEDTANEPAAVTSTSALNLTTASFTPNPGDLLVLLVSTCGGNSGATTLTITNTGSLTFTSLVSSAASFYGCSAVYVAQMPGAGGAAAVAGAGSLIAGGTIAPVVALDAAGKLSTGATQTPGGLTLIGTGSLLTRGTTGSPTPLIAAASLSAVGYSVNAALVGTGTLANSVIENSGAALDAAASFVLGATETPGPVTLQGTGTLPAIPGTSGGAAVQGTGTLSNQLAVNQSAALTGTGSLIPKVTLAPGVLLDAAGTLTSFGFAIGAAIAGTGSVIANARIGGTALITGVASLLTAAVQSPALEAFGFGTFPQIPAGSAISSVTVVINEWSSTSAMNAPSFELWDGTSAKIGTTQIGTPSTSPYNLDSATFTGVTYAQLATLRVRIYANAGSAVQGDQELANSVSLTVAFTPSVNSTVAVAVLKEATTLPAVTTVGQHNATATAGSDIPVFTSFPAVTCGQLSNVIRPATLSCATVLPPVTAQGIINASITVSALTLASNVVACTVTTTSTGPGYAKSADIASGIGTSVGTWTTVSGVTGPPDSSEAVWTRP